MPKNHRIRYRYRPLFLRVPDDLRDELTRIARNQLRSVNSLSNTMLREKVEEERKQAAVLRKALLAARNSGKKSANEVVDLARKIISEAALARIDYVDLVDTETLQPIESGKPNSVLAVAVFFGKTRLIDNIMLG